MTTETFAIFFGMKVADTTGLKKTREQLKELSNVYDKMIFDMFFTLYYGRL